MTSSDEQLWWSLGYCTFMLVLAFLLQKFPPKKINSIYGYRTPRSMKNQQTWDVANRYSGELMVRFCFYSFLVPTSAYFLFPEYNLLLTLGINTLLVILVVVYTEAYLKKRFDKNGDQISGDPGLNA